MAKTEDNQNFAIQCRILSPLNDRGWGKGGYLAYSAGSEEHKHTHKPMLFELSVNCKRTHPLHKPLPLNHAQFGAYFLLQKLLLWLFVRDEGEIFGKAERLEAPDDLRKIKNIMLEELKAKPLQPVKLKHCVVFFLIEIMEWDMKATRAKYKTECSSYAQHGKQ